MLSNEKQETPNAQESNTQIHYLAQFNFNKLQKITHKHIIVGLFEQISISLAEGIQYFQLINQ